MKGSSMEVKLDIEPREGEGCPLRGLFFYLEKSSLAQWGLCAHSPALNIVSPMCLNSSTEQLAYPIQVL